MFMATTLGLEAVLAQVEGLRETYNYHDEHEQENMQLEDEWDEVRGKSYNDTYALSLSDTQRRESARQQLQQTYDSSEWYSARYVAGRALNLSKEKMNRDMDSWLVELTNQLKSTKEGRRKVIVGSHFVCMGGGGVMSSCDAHAGPNDSDRKYEEVDDYKERLFDLVDFEKRQNTIRDARHLFQLTKSPKAKTFLESVYVGKFDSLLDEAPEDVNAYRHGVNLGLKSKIRTEAGKALGYSSLRVWVHEHPVVAAFSGTTLGIASLFGYMMYQYMAR